MSKVKQLLKKANESIKEKLFSQALYEVDCVLDIDPKNYMAHIFKGYIKFHNENNIKEAEKYYLKASDIDPFKDAGWQGLIEVYEKYNHVDGLLNCWEKLAELCFTKQDYAKCLEYVNKVIVKCEDIKQNKQSIQWYSYLLSNKAKFGDLVDSKAVLIKIIQIEEENLDQAIAKEIQQRKFRLGAPPSNQIEAEVYKLFIESSALNGYYESYLLEDPQNVSVRNKYILFLIKKIKVSADKQNIFAKILKLFGDGDNISFEAKEWLFDRSNVSSFDEYVFELVSGEDVSVEIKEAIKVYKKFKNHEYTEDEDFSFNSSSSCLFSVLVKLLVVTKIKKDYNLGLRISQNAKEIITTRAEEEGIYLDRVEKFIIDAFVAECLIEGGKGKEEFQRGRKMLENTLAECFEPGNDYVKTGIVASYEKDGNFKKALDVLLELKPLKEKEFFSKQGFLLFMDKQFNAAIEILDKVIKLREGQSEISSDEKKRLSQDYFYLSRSFWEVAETNIKDKNVCFKLLAISLSFDKENQNSLLYLGYYYKFVSKDIKRAKKCFEKAFCLNPETNTEAGNEVAEMLVSENNLEEAISLYQSLLANYDTSFDSKLCEMWFKLGKIQFKLQRFGEATFSIQTGLRKDRSNVEGWELLGDSYYRQGRYVSAMKAYGKAAKLDPKGPRSHHLTYKVARVKYDLGLFEEAKQMFESVNQSSTGETLVFLSRFHLGKCLHDYSVELFSDAGNYAKSFKIINDAIILFQQVSKDTTDPHIISCLRKEISNCRLFLFKHDFELDVVSEFSSEFERALFYYYRYLKSGDAEDIRLAMKNLILYRGSCLKEQINNFAVFLTILENSHHKLAEHLLITVIETDNSSDAWINLGLLYLKNNEIDLAKKCFSQADPENYLGWFLSSHIEKEIEGIKTGEEGNKLSHAVLLSNYTHPDLSFYYSKHLLEKNINLSTALHSILKVKEYYSFSGRKDILIDNLCCLLLERFGRFGECLEIFRNYHTIADTNIHFNFARNLCAGGSYKDSIKVYEKLGYKNNFDFAFGYITSLFFDNRLHDCVDVIEEVTDCTTFDAGNLNQYLLLLNLKSQILLKLYFETQNEEFYVQAGNNLMKSLELNQQFLPALKTLMSIGIVSGDPELCVSVTAQITSIPPHITLKLDPSLSTFGLVSNFYCLVEKDNAKSVNFLQKKLFMNPSVSGFVEFNAQVQQVLYKNKTISMTELLREFHQTPTDSGNLFRLYFELRRKAQESFKLEDQSLMYHVINIMKSLKKDNASFLLSADVKILGYLLQNAEINENDIIQTITYLDNFISSEEKDSYKKFAYFIMLNYLCMLQDLNKDNIVQVAEIFRADNPLITAIYLECIDDYPQVYQILDVHIKELFERFEHQGLFCLRNEYNLNEYKELLNQLLAIVDNSSMEFNLARLIQCAVMLKDGGGPNKNKITKVRNAIKESGKIPEEVFETFQNEYFNK